LPRKFFTITIISLALLAFIGVTLLVLSEHGNGARGNEAAPEPALYITCDNTTLVIPLRLKPIIWYKWIHSVEGTPIIEVYNATPRGLILIMVESQSFGAGHPYNAEELNGTFTVNKSYMVYRAWSPVGKILRIHGDLEYTGNLTIVLVGERNEKITCPSFVNAVLEIKP
jgi:hypothetical protein